MSKAEVLEGPPSLLRSVKLLIWGVWGSQKAALPCSRSTILRSGLQQNAPMMELFFRVPLAFLGLPSVGLK